MTGRKPGSVEEKIIVVRRLFPFLPVLIHLLKHFSKYSVTEHHVTYCFALLLAKGVHQEVECYGAVTPVVQAKLELLKREQGHFYVDLAADKQKSCKIGPVYASPCWLNAYTLSPDLEYLAVITYERRDLHFTEGVAVQLIA